MLNVKMIISKLLRRLYWTDITAQFTVNSTYVLSFKAYTNGSLVSFMLTTKGAPDQTNVVTIPQEYRAPFSYFAVPVFFMNGTDFARNTNVAVVGSSIQLRCSTASQGTGGVQIGGIYPIL